jgi:type II secretory pathway component GspD/PulD (secretin)
MTRLLFGCVLLGIGLQALSQGVLEIIPLRHRTVDQVLPVLRPLVEPGGTLTGQGNQLIVRASPANLAEIRRVLESIDTPLRRLMISVRFEDAAQARDSSVDSRVVVRSGEAGTSGSAAVRIQESRSARDERVDQRVQVLEGGRAYIASGESRPLRQRSVARTPSGTVVTENTVIQEAASGFEVVPRLAGDTVILDIAQQREAFAPGRPGMAGATHGQRASSSASGRLGEWFELGGISGSSERDERGILSARAAAASGSRRVWVKVEEVKP